MPTGSSSRAAPERGGWRTRHLKVDPERPEAALIDEAAGVLRSGGLVAFPTETVYGLGADAMSREAVDGIFAAKGRPSDNPVIVHVAGHEQIHGVVAELPEVARRLMHAFWPGPLTLVLPKAADVPDNVTAGLPSVAVRMPHHSVARALLAAAGVPIAAPSANRSGRPSPTSAAHVTVDLDGRIDVILDGGPCAVGVESTVLDLTAPVPTVLRPGAVTLEMLREVIGEVRLHGVASGTVPEAAALPSPGLRHRHYAPEAHVEVFEGSTAIDAMGARWRDLAAQGARVHVLLSVEGELQWNGAEAARTVVAARSDPSTWANRLYDLLRAADERGDSHVLVEAVADEGVGLAVLDRLRRAARR